MKNNTMKTQIKATLLLFTILTLLSCSKDDDTNDTNSTNQLFLEKLSGQQFKEAGYDDAYYYFANGNELWKGTYITPEDNCIDETEVFRLDGKLISKFFGGEDVEDISLEIKLHNDKKLVFEYYYLEYLNTANHIIMQYEFEYRNNRVYETYSNIDPSTRVATELDQIVYEKSNVNLPTSFCQ
jgi:hypothetical protein